MHEKNFKLAQLDFPRPHFEFLALAGLDTYPSIGFKNVGLEIRGYISTDQYVWFVASM